MASFTDMGVGVVFGTGRFGAYWTQEFGDAGPAGDATAAASAGASAAATATGEGAPSASDGTDNAAAAIGSGQLAGSGEPIGSSGS